MKLGRAYWLALCQKPPVGYDLSNSSSSNLLHENFVKISVQLYAAARPPPVLLSARLTPVTRGPPRLRPAADPPRAEK